MTEVYDDNPDNIEKALQMAQKYTRVDNTSTAPNEVEGRLMGEILEEWKQWAEEWIEEVEQDNSERTNER